MTAIQSVVERVTPWLLDLGTWIFGALLAFTLLMLGALLTVGPVDPAVLVATAAFAIGLPTEVAGFVVLRLAADMKTISLRDVASRAFQDVGFTLESKAPSSEPELVEKRRMLKILAYTYVLLAVATLLTFVGLAAVLFHMAWWISLAFVLSVVISQALVFAAVGSGRSSGIWRPPAARRDGVSGSSAAQH